MLRLSPQFVTAFRNVVMKSRSRNISALTSLASATLLSVLSTVAHAQRGSDSSVGYIDPAIPMNVIRERYDNVFGNNRPDRAEFFWPDLYGPPKPESNVNYADLASYGEMKLADRFSIFAELPARFLRPEQNRTHNGIGDITAGFKAALLYTPKQVLTFEFKTYSPSAKSTWGLGTGHVSLEPGLLYYQQLTERLRLEAELTNWIPIVSSDTAFAGNVITYGTGLSYQIAEGETFRVRPIAEVVGWSVLGGKETVFDGSPNGQVISASGDTIVNAKLGLRVAFGSTQYPDPDTKVPPLFDPRSDLYFGFGQCLTPDRWYNEIFRIEFRIFF